MGWSIEYNILISLLTTKFIVLFRFQNIHNNDFIHWGIHSGNMLSFTHWKIGDLGLSHNSSSNDHEIYGVIPCNYTYEF